MKITEGTIWLSPDFIKFKVDAVKGDWVFYTRLSDNTQYSCLVEAFVRRFSQHIN